MATDLMSVVTEGGVGRGEVAFPVEPLPGDVVRLDQPEDNLTGRFYVRRREITGGPGVGGPVVLVVEKWER